MAISNSEIKYNRAMATESYDGGSGSKVNHGRGGGFYLVGKRVNGELTLKPSCTMTNVDVSNNIAMYYGGACQVGTGASLTLVSGKFDSNEVVLHGAGGLHITDEATFTLTNGVISNNKAGTFGGGIHTSYSCIINLNGGEIKNNIAYQRGAGIHINVGGNLLLNGTKIIGNKIYAGTTTRYAAEVDETGDNIIEGTIKENEVSTPTGYGGGILIDSGTATMLAGEVSGNYAETGGGGIGFVMIAIGEGSKFGQNKVVSFEMNGGIIENNTCDNNGGAIYLMKNMLSREQVGEGGDYIDGTPIVEINNGILCNNVATNNGGAVYQEENTKFISHENSEILQNNAFNGGAVYIAQGEAEINGGTISDNTSSNSGGAMYVNGDFIMADGVFDNNVAEVSGGAIYITNGNVDIKSGTITNNIALDSGGAIAVTSGNVVIGTKECHDTGESSTHIHPVIEGNIASDGGGIYVDGGVTTMWCGNIKHNLTHEKTVNVLVISGGNFVYNGGTIGIPYDSGVFVNGGIFEDKTDESESVLKHELHYHSGLSDIANNEGIPESKWIASPRGDVLHKEDCDDTSPTWGDLFPEYEFVGWENRESMDTDEIVNLYAIWEKVK
jgi:predicted outer membrane repeat protein